MALVVYTILRSSAGNSRNGTNSAQLFSQLWIIAGYFSRKRSANAAKSSSAAGTVGAV